MTTFSLEKLEFSKYHGLGNDYVLINNLDGRIPESAYSALGKKLCRVHFSVGADGLILVDKSSREDVKFSIINSDGSIAEMCGNGIRCFTKFLHDKKIMEKDIIHAETLAGTKILKATKQDGIVISVDVDMGPPILERSEIPVAGTGPITDIPINIANKGMKFTAVSMGNPHAVFFKDEINVEEVLDLGPAIETHELFPKKVNVEFVKVISPTELDFLVWERGVGMTLACGTGACGSVVAGVLLGKLKRNEPVTVHLQGGDLVITYTDDTVMMNGPAEHSFDGIIENLKLEY
ncbi:MAG: diaminopimelate epimerase [Candidatus Hodarchaeota archaeon]